MQCHSAGSFGLREHLDKNSIAQRRQDHLRRALGLPPSKYIIWGSAQTGEGRKNHLPDMGQWHLSPFIRCSQISNSALVLQGVDCQGVRLCSQRGQGSIVRDQVKHYGKNIHSYIGRESWTIKKAECRRTDAFELWCWRRLLRVPWTVRRSNQSILKEINPEYPLEGLMLKLKLQYFGYLM